VLAFRPEYDDSWDVRIRIDVPEEVSRGWGVARGTEREGAGEAARRLRFGSPGLPR
jgi:hypothetical protein